MAKADKKSTVVRGGSKKKVEKEPVVVVKKKIKAEKESKIIKAVSIETPEQAATNAFLLGMYTKRMDQMERKYALTSSELSIPDRLSSGTLCMDLICGGGYVPGTMVQISGMEKGGKSTACMTTLGSAVSAQIPIIQYWDAENALNDPRYAEAVIRHRMSDLFYGPGRKARLYQESVLEDFYNGTKSLMRTLPDKLYRQEDKTWYFVFDQDQTGRKLMGDFGFKSYEKTLYRDTNRLWCPTNMTGLQGIVFCDSYPALVTADEDEAEESSKGLALDARAFSKNIKKVKGVLKRKAFLLIGVNQIRLNPGVKFGSPEYEPGGNALKFYCMTEDTLLFTSKGIINAGRYKGQGKALGRDGLEKPVGFEYKGLKKVAHLKLHNGMQLRCSHKHGVMAYTAARGVHFSEVGDVKAIQYVAYKIGANVWSETKYEFNNAYINLSENSKLIDLPKTMNPSLARWMGLLVGDGSVHDGRITYTGKKDEVEDFISYVEDTFDIKMSFIDKGNFASTIMVHRHLGTWLRAHDFEHYGINKHVPECILQSTKETVCSFLAGLFDADGCMSVKTLSLHTISTKLATQVQLLLQNLGVDCRIERHSPNGFGGKIRDRYAYRILIYGDNINTFFDNVLCERIKRPNRLVTGKRQGHVLPPLYGWRGMNSVVVEWIETYSSCIPKLLKQRSYFYKHAETYRTAHQRKSITDSLDKLFQMIDMLDEGIRWSKVESIECSFPKERMFDGCMPKSHTIVTNGIISHNSDLRNQNRPRACPEGWGKGINDEGKPTSEYGSEPSVMGEGNDSYSYTFLKNTKNKTGLPYLGVIARIWFRDFKGRPHGYDPVFDVYQYLKITGRLKGGIKEFKITGVPELEGQKIAWKDFKRLVLAEYFMDKEMTSKAMKNLSLGKPLRLRKRFFSELKMGKTFDLLNSKSEKEEVEVDLEAD
jgi:RecA/RadA recombinase